MSTQAIIHFQNAIFYDYQLLIYAKILIKKF